jgi:two-component system, NtrC family, response regulator HydG
MRAALFSLSMLCKFEIKEWIGVFMLEKTKGSIIIVDDDVEMRSLIEDFLRREGHNIKSFPDALQALSFLQKPTDDFFPELIISDIQMPHMTGIEFTSKIKELSPELPVILATAFGSIDSAIDAMKRGAFDYITKPFKLSELSVNVQRALSYYKLQSDNQALRSQIEKKFSRGSVLGKSQAMAQVFDLIERVAQVNANVLITGESGTGKEMVAKTIHSSGPRSDKPFIAVNCTAIPDNLLESELFGHAKGSFTGAYQRKKGLFEEANGGTLFLDEIGDMDVALQAKLLRVIQEKKIRPVGDNVTRDIDVRIIAATHKDLKQAIRAGHFREDLFYRLAVIPIVIPPLRHRKEDIPLLAMHFLKKYASQNGLNTKGFTPGAIAVLSRMKWDGNVRELENMIERIVVLAQKPTITEADIPAPEMVQVEDFYGEVTREMPTMEQLEKRYIQLVLEKTAGKKDRTAQILGINRRTLYRKEREYGLIDPHPSEHDEDHELYADENDHNEN